MTSICKGEAHKLKPTSSNPPPSCLVPRLMYTPPLLPLSSEFVRGTISDMTPAPWPDYIPWCHPHPGQTIYYGDTYTQAELYAMVTPTAWPDHILW